MAHDPDGQIIVVQYAKPNEISSPHRVRKTPSHPFFRSDRLPSRGLRGMLREDESGRGKFALCRRMGRSKRGESSQHNGVV